MRGRGTSPSTLFYPASASTVQIDSVAFSFSNPSTTTLVHRFNPCEVKHWVSSQLKCRTVLVLIRLCFLLPTEIAVFTSPPVARVFGDFAILNPHGRWSRPACWISTSFSHNSAVGLSLTLSSTKCQLSRILLSVFVTEVWWSYVSGVLRNRRAVAQAHQLPAGDQLNSLFRLERINLNRFCVNETTLGHIIGYYLPVNNWFISKK